MRRALKLHPHSVCDAVTGIEVEVTRTSDSLVFLCTVAGTISGIRIPNDMPSRGEGLWRHTCFEAFVGVPPQAAYYEINVAPSRQWAVYRFDDYRNGMAEHVLAPSGIDAQQCDTHFELHVAFPLHGLPGLQQDASWLLGLSAVIEETNGRMSYWALAHPPGKPDFHHPDCFALTLPPA